MSEENIRCVVTGATGLLGGNLASILVEKGYKVRCTKRTTSNISALAHLDIEWVEADLKDKEALLKAFKDCTVVFHAAAQLGDGETPTPEQIAANITGSENVIWAVRQAGCQRLVYVSSVVTIGIPPSSEHPGDESMEWNLSSEGLNDGYATSKKRGEEYIIAAAKLPIDDPSYVDAVVVNPSFMVGSFAYSGTSSSLVGKLLEGKVPAVPAGTMNFVDVRDVANGMILAWKKGVTGERYILGGHALTYERFFQLVGEVAKDSSKIPTIQPPKFVMLGVAWLAEVAASITGNPTEISRRMIHWTYHPTWGYFSTKKAETELGYVISPLEPAIENSIKWWREHSNAQ